MVDSSKAGEVLWLLEQHARKAWVIVSSTIRPAVCISLDTGWAGIRSILGRADARKFNTAPGRDTAAERVADWWQIRMEGTMKTPSRLLPFCALAGGLLLMAGVARGQLLITGNDEKVWFEETGKTVNQPPG